jgi:phosphopantetheinyl transferase
MMETETKTGQRTVWAASRTDLEGSGMVRRLLAYLYFRRCQCRLPQIAKTEAGKPYLCGCPDRFISLSHTAGAVCAGLSDGSIGVDVEGPRSWPAELPARIARPEEIAQFGVLGAWTLKESAIKVKGTLDRDWRDIVYAGTREKIVCPEGIACARLTEAYGFTLALAAADLQVLPDLEWIPEKDLLLF